jgi:hypothetical protein
VFINTTRFCQSSCLLFDTDVHSIITFAQQVLRSRVSCLFNVQSGYFPGKIDRVGKFIEEYDIVFDDGDFRRAVHRDEFIVLPDTET